MKLSITGSSGFVGISFIKNTKGRNITEVDLLEKKIAEVNFTGVIQYCTSPPSSTK